MPMPLIIWGGVALVSALAGAAGTLAVTDAADELGDAVEQGANSLNRLLTTTAIAGTLYLAYRHRGAIGKFVKGK